jgi:plastocyanin
MAGFTFDIASGQIDVGDTKTLTFAPKDRSGDLVSLSSLTLTIEEGQGRKATYDQHDAVENGGEFVVEHTFQEPGTASFDATVEDMGGRTERETGRRFVHH